MIQSSLRDAEHSSLHDRALKRTAKFKPSLRDEAGARFTQRIA